MGAASKYRSGIWLGWCVILAPFASCVLLAVSACGGGGTAGSSPPPATAHDKTKAEPSEEASEGDEPVEEESAPPRSACDDGTCSACGTGMCPTGWYCDESVSGGPACSWLPQCAQKSSCGCISSALGSGCKCVEQGGGLHVTCK